MTLTLTQIGEERLLKRYVGTGHHDDVVDTPSSCARYRFSQGMNLNPYYKAVGGGGGGEGGAGIMLTFLHETTLKLTYNLIKFRHGEDFCMLPTPHFLS